MQYFLKIWKFYIKSGNNPTVFWGENENIKQNIFLSKDIRMKMDEPEDEPKMLVPRKRGKTEKIYFYKIQKSNKL